MLYIGKQNRVTVEVLFHDSFCQFVIEEDEKSMVEQLSSTASDIRFKRRFGLV